MLSERNSSWIFDYSILFHVENSVCENFVMWRSFSIETELSFERKRQLWPR